MITFTFRGKAYRTDAQGFLLDSSEWDEGFAEGLAPRLQIHDGLTKAHWVIIKFIRDTYRELGKCPTVYQTCRMNRMHLSAFKNLFPTGYLRGACKLAGLTYKEGYLKPVGQFEYVDRVPAGIPERAERSNSGNASINPAEEKVYGVDVRGFLVDPDEWDEIFAMHKAYEMKVTEKLTDRHWQIIHYLRDSFEKNGVVPTVYETCEANHLEIEELERLFPDGYHRGAVKIAGLRVR